MALLNILTVPDPRLKISAIPVARIDAEIKQIIADMAETMYNATGIGLAATQVNINKRIAVIDVTGDKKHLLCLINPVIIKHSGTVAKQEGCLSLPGIYAPVKRYASITIEYQDLENITQSITATDLLSICIQHEIDHLNGITFYDRLSNLRKTFLKNKIKELSQNLSQKY